VADADGLGLGVGEGAAADVVGCVDGEPDGGTRADVDRPGLAEPCGCGACTRLGETSGPVVTGAESATGCRALLRAVT
jgi:hypothetical protein